jgi:hypothetical protein
VASSPLELKNKNITSIVSMLKLKQTSVCKILFLNFFHYVPQFFIMTFEQVNQNKGYSFYSNGQQLVLRFAVFSFSPVSSFNVLLVKVKL